MLLCAPCSRADHHPTGPQSVANYSETFGPERVVNVCVAMDVHAEREDDCSKQASTDRNDNSFGHECVRQRRSHVRLVGAYQMHFSGDSAGRHLRRDDRGVGSRDPPRRECDHDLLRSSVHEPGAGEPGWASLEER